MAYYLHQLTFYIHVLAGSMALVLFWLPLFAKKGSQTHIQYGRYFANGMMAVAVSGFVMTTLVLIDPVAIRDPSPTLSQDALDKLILQNRLFSGFLFMLSLLVFNCVRMGVNVLKEKENRFLLRKLELVAPLVFQLLCSVVIGWAGFQYQSILFQVFAGLCFANSIGSLRYIYKKHSKKREWLIEHMSAILGAGIGAYTAFFVFGGSRLFSHFIQGQGQIVLWVLPGVLGTVATVFLTKRYQKQYRVN